MKPTRVTDGPHELHCVGGSIIATPIPDKKKSALERAGFVVNPPKPSYAEVTKHNADLESACYGLLGLLTLLSSGDSDGAAFVKHAIKNNHRIREARAALAKGKA